MIDGPHDATQSEINVSRKIRWVKIKATGIQPSGFEIAVVAKNKKTSNRLTVLKLPVGDSETTWLVRIEPGYSEFWLNILRGRPDAVKIYHVSSSDAWRTIVYDRWRKGKVYVLH